MIGIARVLASTTKKTAKRAKLPTSDPTTHGLLHGSSLPPKLSPTSWIEIAVTNNKDPVKSTLVKMSLKSFPRSNPPSAFFTTSAPTTRANAETGTWRRKHHLQPIPSAIEPPKEAPQIAPNPNMPFCNAWYMPRLRKGIMSEFTIVAVNGISSSLRPRVVQKNIPIVMSPPPPKPVSARMQLRNTMLFDTLHPRHPRAKVIVEMKKHTRRPKMSDTLPYRG